MDELTAYAGFRHRMDAVFNGYVTCALWSEGCQGTARGFHSDPSRCRGDNCDSSLSHDLNFGPDDLSAAAVRDMEADLESFVKGCLSERPNVFDGIADDDIGYDFWLTRNGHGVGFWDRGLGERGDWLTAMAKPFGGSHLYVNGDGKVEVQ